MGVLLGPIRALKVVNDLLLRLGRALAVAALAVMVGVILAQVFFRYVLNDALPWPDEAARFFMLWMTGLIAPMAYRRGGFVAIDMLERALPRAAGALLSLVLLALSLGVLVFAARIGWNEVTGFGGTFATASLWVPTSITFDEWFRVPRSWMMASLLVGLWLLILVNVELILRQVATLLGAADLPELQQTDLPEAE
ncbi:TRAP transporter small permease [Rhodovulum sp. 12E13]|uniref:TRAP transporter small permease n=1 Tax=Rhodovulum sp. 12E13 TaxID=2203891 RepID=UPI000E14ECA6|nr:TRAP transporter small permease [Rhodovulum sp. 12E13]RDC72236.1 TRAP transporter small permease [Rhodovulum sp. 12E13]